MKWAKEERLFEGYLDSKKLKHSRQRTDIMSIFLNTDKHLTANELYEIVRKKYPGVGFATIYRTLKLLCECGLCRELRFDEGTTRFEHLYGHTHHDHLICTKCGVCIEVVDPEIERLQEKLSRQHGFFPQRHRMELYGLCKKCKK